MSKARLALLALAVVFASGSVFVLWRLGVPSPVSTNPSSPDESVLSGRVVDAHGPVGGARVRFQGRHEATLTDSDGHFQLTRPQEAVSRVTAWKEGYFIAGTSVDSDPLVLTLHRLPTGDCEEYAWVSPDPDRASRHNCGNCHADMHREWAASAHARSATGQHFRNLYDGSDWHGRPNVGWNLLAEHPNGVGVCTACHAPTVPFSDPAYHDLRKATGVAARGVHCDGCHKISNVSNEQFGLTHGRFGLDLLRPAEGQLFFGSLDDVDRDEDTFSPLYKESRYCASCHEGTVFGVAVYTTYSEWLKSPAREQGKQCQTCHMAPAGTESHRRIATGGILRDVRTLSNHRFLAGSLEEMLRGSLQVRTTLTTLTDGVRAEVEVRADNVGHQVPTGFVDRNLVLVVEAFDREKKPLAPREGSTLPPLAGPEHGRAGRLFAKVLSDFDGHSPVPFWRAQPEVVDTRLRPGHAERTTFVFPAAAERVRVRLLYRRFWPEVAQKKGWPDNEITVVDRWLEVRPSP